MKKFAILLTSICGFSLNLSSATEIDRDVDPVAYFNQQHLIALQEQLQMAEAQLEKQEDGQQKLRALRSRLVERRRELQGLRAQRSEVRRNLKKERDEFSNYHEEVKIATRAEAQGETLPVLQVPAGRTFEDVIIRDVNDVGLVITHRDGRARVAFSDLSPEFGERFFYDPELAAEIVAAERHAEDQRSSLLAARLVQQKAVEAKKAKDEAYRAAMMPVTSSSSSRSRSYSSYSSDQYSSPVKRSSRPRRRNRYYYIYRNPQQTRPSSHCPVPAPRVPRLPQVSPGKFVRGTTR